MPADAGDRRLARVPGTMASHPPPQLTCPRCDSNNTKFCYYNNYNLSQPRYFCKSCRRYWTQGGALRNVPVGGGTRKSSKRSRSPSGSSPSVAASYSSHSSVTHEAESLTTDVSPVTGVKPEVDIPSFLISQGQGHLTLGDYGFGAGSGFDGNWGYPGNGHLSGFNGGDGGLPGGNTWQATTGFEGGGEGIVDEDFGWSGLAIQQQEKVWSEK